MTSDDEELRVGVDVVSVSAVEHSIARFGERYLQHVFSEAEQHDCVGSARHQAEGLAARFAAKEAAIKVLRPEGIAGLWTSIEVSRLPSGATSLKLSGVASELADDAGISTFAVSLAHEGDVAVAVVLATCHSVPDLDRSLQAD